MSHIRKIIKNRETFEDPKNNFKYGEYLESLNEEITFNIENF